MGNGNKELYLKSCLNLRLSSDEIWREDFGVLTNAEAM